MKTHKAYPSLTKLLAHARTGMDPCSVRGVCRGAYIVSGTTPADNRYYMTHDGRWTFGIETGDSHWWRTQIEADRALEQFRDAERGKPARSKT